MNHVRGLCFKERAEEIVGMMECGWNDSWGMTAGEFCQLTVGREREIRGWRLEGKFNWVGKFELFLLLLNALIADVNLFSLFLCNLA